jgi:hypothetical protein
MRRCAIYSFELQQHIIWGQPEAQELGRVP